MLKRKKQKEIVIRDGIPIPREFRNIIRPGTRVLVRTEGSGIFIKPKIDPIEDLIGSLSIKKRIDVEKELDERFEHVEEVY